METDSKQPTGANTNPMPWVDDFKKLIEKFQLPGVDVAALADWQRKDLEALAEANRQAYEGIKALIERRNEIVKETLAQWQAAAKDVAGASAAMRLLVELALTDTRIAMPPRPGDDRTDLD